MRYRVRGLTLRSENAAKTPRERSRPLAKWLCDNVRGDAAMDYGCGRLRYTPFLARNCRALGLVDSAIQLDRPTLIGGRASTIRAAAMETWPRCRIYTLEDFWRGIEERYDFVLCANVLSVIPSRRIRSRSLRAIRACLSRQGTVLVVNQHTNSYFTQAANSPHSFDHLDGWILKSRKGPAYFGVLRQDEVRKLLCRHGFQVRGAWVEGQSNYVLASR